jgi:pre-mRNA-splicing factor RBM22/SLT11
MASIKRDDVKQQWEDTEFPLVCETCLGDNPYVRMTKETHGKKCQICETPFTVFAWQAGTKGRMKRVEICRSCAKAKNVCQVCIYDLQYGLPVKVRDRVLRESGSAAAVSVVPQSIANRAWYTAQQQRVLDQGGNLVGAANELASAKLQDMARMEPRYERNLPKLCSFFARGECDRGANCPFRHEMPRDRNDPLSKQNTHDRFYGTSDPVANKILGRKRRQEEALQKEDENEGYDKARATVYLRFQGDGPFPNINEMDIRDKFYGYGEIVSVRAQPDRGQAFVEYSQPEAAELAIVSMNRKELSGRQIFVAWARASKRGDAGIEKDRVEASSSGPVTFAVQPMAPPGGMTKKHIPKNLTRPKPPPEVAAIVAARRLQLASHSASMPASNLLRPSGGSMRGGDRNASIDAKPYYPSADPSRLGSKAAPSE